MQTIYFKVKQHSPLIHFQHQQERATLRASEVKPKLDRFIINKYGGVAELRKIHPDWFGSNKHDALDYKLLISAAGERKDYAISSNPNSPKNDEFRRQKLNSTISADYINRTQYFADNQFIDKEQQHSKIRKGILYDSLNVKIISFNFSLVTEIKLTFPIFIISENFGTRQSKGFGCFTMHEMGEDQILEGLKSIPEVTGIFKISSNQSFESKLQYISDHYGKLKRGVSYPSYQKSKLWSFVCSSQSLKWEKRKIKLHIKNNDLSLFNSLRFETSIHRIDDCERAEDHNNYMYVRALLGIAEQYEFILNGTSEKMKVHIKDGLKKNEATKKYSIDRFSSPIRYFITEQSIYLITERITPLLQTYYDDMGDAHDREFEFSIDRMKGNNGFLLKVPKSFDLPAFIKNTNTFGSNLK